MPRVRRRRAHPSAARARRSSFPLVLVLAAAISAFVTPSFAAKTSLLPELVGEDERVLSEANALLQGAQRITLPRPGARRRTDRRDRGGERAAPRRAVVRLRLPARPHFRSASRARRARRRVARSRCGLPRPRPRPTAAAVERGLIIGDVAWIVLFAAMPVLVIAQFGEIQRSSADPGAPRGIGAVAGNVIAFPTATALDRLSSRASASSR